MPYQVPESRKMSVPERIYLPELIRGMVITTKHFLANLFGKRDPALEVLDRKGVSQVSTIEYPEERPHYPPGYRGLHRLVPREDGEPRCVACYMCATACPAQCIYIEAEEYAVSDPKAPNAVIEKHPKKFVIDELRCVVCGFCVEACPKDAIRMDTGLHSSPGYQRLGFVLDEKKLLKGPPVSHPSDPWNVRKGSKQPEHVHKEAHTAVGAGR